MNSKVDFKTTCEIMKRLIVVTILLIVNSVNAGWFGSSIEGAFGLKFDKSYPKDVKVRQKNSNFEQYFTVQGYDNKLISIGAYSKKCSHKKRDAIVDMLTLKYKEPYRVSRPARYDNSIPTTFYYWKDDEIEITLACGHNRKGLSKNRGLELSYRDWDAFKRWGSERRQREDNSGL